MLAEKHPKESARLAALGRYQIVDSEAEAEFDEVVRMVSAVCDMPVSLISLVESDRQWFKARAGIAIGETPIAMSVCAHGILQPDLLEIPDTTKDFRTIDNPIVVGDPNVRFYAGAALLTEDGLPLGMLCVLDYVPRTLSEVQRNFLQVMAKLVMRQFELRRALKVERSAHAMVQEILEKANTLLERNTVLRREIDHRVKNSLTQVAAFLRLQERSHKDEPKIAQALAEARNRVVTVASVHDQLHRSAEDDKVSVAQFLADLAETVSQNRPPNLQAIEVEADAIKLTSDKVMALGLATNEIVANAMKHAFGPGDAGIVRICFREVKGRGVLTVSDNGRGVPADFDLKGNSGLGLRVLNSLAQQLEGRLSHEDGAQGAVFILDFPLGASTS